MIRTVCSGGGRDVDCWHRQLQDAIRSNASSFQINLFNRCFTVTELNTASPSSDYAEAEEVVCEEEEEKFSLHHVLEDSAVTSPTDSGLSAPTSSASPTPPTSSPAPLTENASTSRHSSPLPPDDVASRLRSHFLVNHISPSGETSCAPREPPSPLFLSHP